MAFRTPGEADAHPARAVYVDVRDGQVRNRVDHRARGAQVLPPEGPERNEGDAVTVDVQDLHVLDDGVLGALELDATLELDVLVVDVVHGGALDGEILDRHVLAALDVYSYA
jgi:hypothetical protein